MYTNLFISLSFQAGGYFVGLFAVTVSALNDSHEIRVFGIFTKTQQ